MNILFDTSVLIASIVESHPKHELAFSWLKKAKDKEFNAIVSSHSILEIYSVLTAAPFKPKISSELAKLLIDTNIRKYFRTAFLSSDEYYNLLAFVSSHDLKGGIAFDALIYECAMKSKADKIVTLNGKDFTRLNVDKSIEIVSV